jgi:bifunctional DNA-binding transcriptional regulator/antitoxin component of YhaV-PrlF toxin-antitoxin module
MEVVIQKGRYIEIPEYIMRKLGLQIGGKVTITEKASCIEIANPEYVADKLRGSIKCDKKKIDEIIKAEIWELQ